jgi:hypothetical protein
MRSLPLAVAMMVGGCAAHPPATASADPPPPIPEHGVTPGHICRLQGTERFVGRTGDDDVKAAILRASNAAVLRWAPPGVAMTMDYRTDRVTVYVTADRKITKISCG